MRAAALLLTGYLIVGAAAPAHAAAYHAPRNVYGQPDLEGAWRNDTLTDIERSKDFAGPYATPAEAAAYLKMVQDDVNNVPPPVKPGDPPPKPNVGQSEWFDLSVGLLRIDGRIRSSIVTEPSDGKIPYNAFGLRVVQDARRRHKAPTENPEDRPNSERCLLGSGSPLTPPMLPPVYNAHYDIIQTRDTVAIVTEMIHDIRIIRIGGKHEATAPRWFGDSVGHWEGETLVVETVNQHPMSVERPADPLVLVTPAARVTERFTRTGPNEIRYRFTVEDPAVYTQKWGGELMFLATAEPMIEYACHEGNYGLANILRGARHDEAEAARKAEKPAAPAPTP